MPQEAFPHWYRLVEEEFNARGLHPGLVLEPESIQRLWWHAEEGVDASLQELTSEEQEREAARRVAAAIEVLYFGEESVRAMTTRSPGSPPVGSVPPSERIVVTDTDRELLA